MFQKKPSASEVDDVQYRRAKTWQIICYACNAFVGMSVYSLIGMASYSASIGYGITTATVGIILMLARILDAFTDPMLAFVYDRVNPDYAMDNRKNVTNWFDGELDESCWSVKDNMAAAMADPKAGPILKQIREKAAASRGDVAAAVKDNPALVAMMERAMQRMTIQSMLMQAGTSEEDIKQLNRVLQGISKD